MRIGSSFDTDLKKNLIKEYAQRYWSNDTIAISRSVRYLILNCIWPTIVLVSRILLLVLLQSYNTANDSLNSTIDFILVWIGIVSIIRRWYWILEKYMNYYMDFCIITPNEIILYSQYWFFRRKSKIARTSNIKVITVDWSWFWRSLLNYWDITIFFEWNYSSGSWANTSKDNTNIGTIKLFFFSDIESTKNRIKKLLDLAIAVEQHDNND